MKVFTLRLPNDIANKIKIKAEIEHRTFSEQIKKYVSDGILSEEYPDLPVTFIKETLQAKMELDEGLGTEYKFGTIDWRYLHPGIS